MTVNSYTQFGVLSSTTTVSSVLKTDSETIQAKHRSTGSLQTGEYNVY